MKDRCNLWTRDRRPLEEVPRISLRPPVTACLCPRFLPFPPPPARCGYLIPSPGRCLLIPPI